MKIALVHDDLVQWGGAERVLEGLCELFPEAPIFTSLYDRTNISLKRSFGSKKIITSFLQKIPGWKSMYKMFLPLYPIAFEQFNFDRYDLVISQTTRFAKSIITKPQTKHICYCHTPPRFLWHLSEPGRFRLSELMMSQLRVYDQISSRRVDYFIAGSRNAQQRIKKIYGRDSRVIYPFLDSDRFRNVEVFDGGYFLMIARPGKYKRLDLAKAVCQKMGLSLKVISGGIDDKIVTAILAGCRALIIPGVEDFGLASLEAQALGKPVIAFRQGGALETVIEGKTGIFFDGQTVRLLEAAIKKLETKKIDAGDCRQNAYFFSKENFMQNFKQAVESLV